MISDFNKGIENITYNHLNLPTEILFANGSRINYLYDATGRKVRKIVTDASLGTEATTDYMGGYQYLDGVLKFFPTPEGYVNATEKLGIDENETIFSYVYNYVDHLGNIRVSYTQDPITHVLKILEENHYYPFGLKHSNYNSGKKILDIEKEEADIDYGKVKVKPVVITDKSAYNYKYNGKELQDELGLNLYDYGARNYDPALGRWMNIDNSSETYFSNSPYNYAGNNPIIFVDYDGNDFGISIKDGVITITQVWYNDGKSKTIDLVNKAIDYLNSNSGKYGVKTKDGTVMPINFSIEFSNEKGETVDDGFTMHDSNIDKAESDDTANYISAGGMEVRNQNARQSVTGSALRGGDDTKYCADCNMYGDTIDYNANEGVISHEMMHALGISHTAIGKNGTTMTKDAIGGMLQYASKNSRGLKVNLSNVKPGSYLGSKQEPLSKIDKPKVVNTSPQNIKLNGTIVEIK